MRVLFVNQSFPGALGLLAAAFAAAGNEVFFAAVQGRKNVRIRGVQRIELPEPEKAPESNTEAPVLSTAVSECAGFLKQEDAVSRALAPLRRQGSQPDLICSAADPGLTLFLKGLFPRAYFVCYAEWYYSSTYFPRLKAGTPKDIPAARVMLRNAWQAAVIAECNLAFTATQWQRAQYPSRLARGIEIFHRCVDTDAYCPMTDTDKRPALLENVKEVVTVTGRGMESTPDFKRLLEALKLLLKDRPDCHVVLFAALPEDVQALVKDEPRIHPMTFVAENEYRGLLRCSDLYVYPNDSSMLTSGIFEALSCGLAVMATNRGAVAEIVRDGENAYLFNMKDTAENLAASMAGHLNNKAELKKLREGARETIIKGFSMKTEMQRQIKIMTDGCNAWKARFQQK